MAAVFQGIMIGALLSIFIGATFFILIETSITKGFNHAVTMNIGVFLSDVTIIIIAYFGANEFLNRIIQSEIFKLCGGIAFLSFGTYYLLKKIKNNDLTPNININHSRLFFKGFFINILNPSVIAFWLGTIVLALSHHNFTPRQIFTFFASCLLVVITTDILKIFFASKLKSFVNIKIMRTLRIVTGIIFIGLGLRIILYIYF